MALRGIENEMWTFIVRRKTGCVDGGRMGIKCGRITFKTFLKVNNIMSGTRSNSVNTYGKSTKEIVLTRWKNREGGKERQ